MVRRKSDSPQKAALREIMSNSLKENDVLSKKYQNTVTQAIEAVYPHAGIQQCIIHQTRNSTKYVSYKDLNKLMANLKKVYAAPGEQAALSNLEDFGENGMRNTRKYRSSGKNTGQILRHISSIRRQSAIGEEKALDGEYHTHGQKACIGAEKCRQQHAAAHMPGRPRPRNWHQRTIPAV